jgi:hypothetical protein
MTMIHRFKPYLLYIQLRIKIVGLDEAPTGSLTFNNAAVDIHVVFCSRVCQQHRDKTSL